MRSYAFTFCVSLLSAILVTPLVRWLAIRVGAVSRPRARDILQATTRDDVSTGAFPYMSARTIRIGAAEVWAQRVTYVGELGWELYARSADAGAVWDALMAAGRPVGVAPVGYKALDQDAGAVGGVGGVVGALQRDPVGGDAQSRRSTMSFLISAIALAGFRPFGQVWAQFMMVWQR